MKSLRDVEGRREERVESRARQLSEEERRSLVSRYSSSGLSRVEFCRREGIGQTTLFRWLSKYGESECSWAAKGGFVELKSSGNGLGVVCYSLELSSGLNLSFSSGFCAKELSELVLLLEGKQS